MIFSGGEEYTVVRKGNVHITFGRRNLIFLNVYHVPSMELNLLFVSQIMQHCPKLDIIFSSHKCHIVDKESKKTVVVGLKDHGLYRPVDTRESQEHAMVVKSLSINTLGHQRYGHLNLAYLSQLA